ncbi:MAG: FAD-dependent oxidoreductase [Candidatus Handelsmanbacteria bacterium]|nr:FAD-dependent oxidoreductase [Candidatus Handelsmanbacteria bacterium]
MKREVEVLVIGGGVVGVCAAYFLGKQGRQVVLVEKGELCAGSSYGNAGLVVPSHSVPLAAPGVAFKALKWMLDPESPFYVAPRWDAALWRWLWNFWRTGNENHVRRALPLLRDLHLASKGLFAELTRLKGMACAYEERGALYAFRTRAGLEAGIAEGERLGGAGLPPQVLDRAGVEALEGMEARVEGGVYYPQDAHLVPDRFVRGMGQHLRGAEVLTQTEVLELRREGGRIVLVRTTRGDFAPREVVLAAGSWSPLLARQAGLSLPIQAAKGYSITLKKPLPCPAVPLLLGEAKVGVTPMGEWLRFAGTLELAGLDLRINQRRVEAILRAVPSYLPQIEPAKLELVEIWRGLRPATPDGLPFLGRAPGCGNLTVAAGHATIGLSLGPITGKLVAQVVCGSPEFDLSLLRVDRF